MDLNFVRLVFTLKLETDCADSLALFGLKPFFLEALRQAAGCSQEPCAREGDCAYHHLTSQELSLDPAALKRFQKPAYPFVFDVPVIPPLPNAGSTVELGVTLAGTAVVHVDAMTAAISGLLTASPLRQKFRATIVQLETVGHDGSRSRISLDGPQQAGGQVVTLSLRGLLAATVLPVDRLVITLMTPLRLMSEGRPRKEFDGAHFLRALLRRLSSLVYYYGGEAAEYDFKWLSAQSLQVETAVADFRWVEQGSRWSGVLGSVRFTGLLTDFHPFLLAGELVHVGKGASFGMGAYRVDKGA